jgi:hypothetical protein
MDPEIVFLVDAAGVDDDDGKNSLVLVRKTAACRRS